MNNDPRTMQEYLEDSLEYTERQIDKIRGYLQRDAERLRLKLRTFKNDIAANTTMFMKPDIAGLTESIHHEHGRLEELTAKKKDLLDLIWRLENEAKRED